MGTAAAPPEGLAVVEQGSARGHARGLEGPSLSVNGTSS